MTAQVRTLHGGTPATMFLPARETYVIVNGETYGPLDGRVKVEPEDFVSGDPDADVVVVTL